MGEGSRSGYRGHMYVRAEGCSWGRLCPGVESGGGMRKRCLVGCECRRIFQKVGGLTFQNELIS